MEATAPERIGKFEFGITASQASDEERQSRRCEVLTAWLLNQWQQKQSEQGHAPDFSLN